MQIDESEERQQQLCTYLCHKLLTCIQISQITTCQKSDHFSSHLTVANINQGLVG